MNKTILVMVVVDVVGLLADDTLDGNIYLFDNNRRNGSENEGTGQLKIRFATEEKDADITIVWNVMSIEPEAYVAISNLEADSPYLTVSKEYYKSSDIAFWKCEVEKEFEKSAYQLSVKAGNREKEYTCELELERI